MTDERILEIARRYDSNCNMYSVSYVFSKEDLIAFARSVIEANRKCSDEPVAWYDKHGMITHDPFEGVTPLYTRPAPARKPLSNDEILRVATKSPPFIPWLLQEGVTLGDVRGMAVDFARRIEKAHGIGETE